MPIVAPQLDDLRYERMVDDIVRRIPVYAPEWTDFNDSDPGITMVQLFAYLAEQLGYRLNRIPEKNHIELLKLLGVRLKPARAATTRLAFLLADPATTVGFTLNAGAKAKAKKGSPPPTFETDAAVDIVPAEPNLLLVTKNPLLWDLRQNAAGGTDALGTPPDAIPSDDTPWLTVAWDGKKPKLRDMPLEPVPLFGQAGQQYLWLGLDLNAARDAGFLGARVTLAVQLDDDETPRLTATEECVTRVAGELPPLAVDWLAYYDVPAGTMLNIPARIADSTEQLTRSGTIRFDVPFGFGPIPAAKFRNLRDASATSALDACFAFGTTMQGEISSLPADEPVKKVEFKSALTQALSAVQAAAGQVEPAIGHPLDPKYRDPAKQKGWLRIRLAAPLTTKGAAPRLRIATFNIAPATNASTVTNELVGSADGRPGQLLALGNRNVLDRTLELAVQEEPDRPLVTWREVESLDAAAPNDRVFALDREAGTVTFGDGVRGRIPALVPRAGNIVAVRYRHGGGKAGETGVATITSLESARAGLSGVTNPVVATGGADAETLDEAKVRARRELATRSRAVTRDDFEWIARQTPTVRVARAQIVPRRRPLPAGTLPPAIATPVCGAPLAAGPSGLDTIEAAGVVSVVVVPDDAGPEPVPTPSFLRRVCCHLDRHRLVTTEVHVVPPQYLRVCEVVITLLPQPGYTRARLQELVEARLATYLHVLTGGHAGGGFPFGGQVHIADLVAQVFRVEGVERVETMTARFTHTKSNVALRQGRLTMCPGASDETDEVQLGPEESVSLMPGSITVSTVT